MSDSLKIFLSHSSVDSEFTKELADQLAKIGAQPWVDKKDLKPWISWDEQIRKALDESDAVVLVLSAGKPAANVLIEAGVALSQRKMIVPVVVDSNAEVGIFSKLSQISAVEEGEIESAAKEIVDSVTRDRSRGQ
jgi:TIR domain